MTPAALLLETLSSMGIRVWVVGDKLRYRTRQGSLPPELKKEIKAHRGELIELLGVPAASIGIRCNTATPPRATPESVADMALTADGGVAASREACRNTWATALEAMAAAWDAYTARCRAAVLEPRWLQDDDLTARIGAAIRVGDLPGARAAITAWQAAWNAVIGHDSVRSGRTEMTCKG